jgi:cellobiose phosphorylase
MSVASDPSREELPLETSHEDMSGRWSLFRSRPDEGPQRAAFLSLDQLRRHGRTLASWHQVTDKPRRDRLLPRLAENTRILREAHEMLGMAAAQGRSLPPAADWLLDNYYLIETQLRLARQHLPRKYSLELPQLVGQTGSAGLPRVYDIASELISHADGQLDAENLDEFLRAYQSVGSLKIGELWAIPIMLRLALIENLRSVSGRIAWQHRDRALADRWAARIAAHGERDPAGLVLATGDLIREDPPLSAAFVARLQSRLQALGVRSRLATEWIDHRLAERGQSIGGLSEQDASRQAADQVTMANTVTSLRELGAFDWPQFVENHSVVEQVLREDPSGFYPTMSFSSRDRYRHVVERIAKRCPRTEAQVARVAVELAQEAGPVVRAPADGRSAEVKDHVGYFLVDRGLKLLESSVGYRPTMWQRLTRVAGIVPMSTYLAGLAVWLAIFLAVVIGSLYALPGPVHWWQLLVMVPLLVVFGSQFALAMLNWTITRLTRPEAIDRLDFSEGIPHEHKTLVIVPTMLSSPGSVARLAEALEVRYLGNRDSNLVYGLLTDFPDADSETLPTDQAILDAARREMELLNAKYAGQPGGHFFVFHRPRRYNDRQGTWMGWERKRGKLADLNTLLLTGRTDAFNLIAGDLARLEGVRYVITLDTDTQLPRGVAAELVGCLAHPLNRPQLDPKTGRVIRGYGILQPRVAITVPDANRSRYSRLFAGEPGIDPYTRQVSDVYQDAFGEGSFIGKGIYDVRAFEISLRDRFPDNLVLSHDLIESAFARSGLVSDVEVLEGFPARLLADMSRRHRWVRGDWQIAPWLLPRVPTATGGARNIIHWLAWWKLFDNLRRSFVPIAWLLVFLLGWLIMPQWALFWTVLGVATPLLPTLIGAAPAWIRKAEGVPWGLHLRYQASQLRTHLGQQIVNLAVLPYEVHCLIDAIGRTLYRMYISRRKLLEWTTASEAEQRSSVTVRDHYEVMAANTLTALGLVPILAWIHLPALLMASPVLLLWFLGPAMSLWLSVPRRTRAVRLSRDHKLLLRKVARKTWHFFDRFVNDSTHWLPPDNYQQDPGQIVTRRTSPTNIALGLLSELAAYDCGYQSPLRLADRLQKSMASLAQLERFRGHLYNWYELDHLQVIEPRYISAVDSGNLAGHLITLRGGLVHMHDDDALPKNFAHGLQDTLTVILELSETDGKLLGEDLRRRIRQLRDECSPPCEGPAVCLRLLNRTQETIALIREALPTGSTDALVHWTDALADQCHDFQSWFRLIAPWTDLPRPPVDISGLENKQVRTDLERLHTKLSELEHGRRLADVPNEADKVAELARSLAKAAASDAEAASRLSDLAVALESTATGIRDLLARFRQLAAECREFEFMDFRFLYHKRKELLAIGYDVSERRLDAGTYDLLASEARLASFVAVAQGQLPADHWFALGRLMTTAGGQPTLLSWSGSMFEYMMPPLVMPMHESTLLDQACRTAIRMQIDYAHRRGTPWGISESCYNLRDASSLYQYRAFGVPGLGLKRGLGDDLVVAPYASAMALLSWPYESCRNMQLLDESGYLGDYGFFDAIDYTPSRRGPDRRPAPCKTFMAHHSGMALLAIDAVLNDRPMQRRFVDDPLCQAHEVLLQERLPSAITPTYPHLIDAFEPLHAAGEEVQATSRSFDTPLTRTPEIHLLGNGRYQVMVSNSGGGWSRWQGLDVTRWRPDATRDNWGQFIYLRDVATGRAWSAAWQPVGGRPQKYWCQFGQGQAEFRRVEHDLDAQTTISVSPEDDVEVRRLTLTNLGRLPRDLDITTYAEIVLADARADRAHPAFSKLFVTTEVLADRRAILATRRKRSPHDPEIWMVHVLAAGPEVNTPASFETDRDRFLGRNRTPADPWAMRSAEPLSNTAGAVLDPIASIRQRLVLEPDVPQRLFIITGAASSREDALALIDKYGDVRVAGRVFELAWSHSATALQQLSMSESDAQAFLRVASALVFPTVRLGSDAGTIARNRRGQRDLWPMAISGDHPIVLARLQDPLRRELARRLLQAHAYWQAKGLVVDLVFIVESQGGYRREPVDDVLGLLAAAPGNQRTDEPGGVFIRQGDQVSDEDRRLLETVASAVFDDSWGPLLSQLDRGLRTEQEPPRLKPARQPDVFPPERRPAPQLRFFNGLGGFTQDGREYIVILPPGGSTPAPWCNVLANQRLGTVVSESHTGYTWIDNAQQFRLTPWNNDPVSDPPGEAIYIRDDETGQFFSPTPSPARGDADYHCRHGFGYTVWETDQLGLRSELWVFVARDEPVKFFTLKLTNRSGRARKLSVFSYVEWTLGGDRSEQAPHTISEIDSPSGGLLARTWYNTEYSGRVAFFGSSPRAASFTSDRSEFLGRAGSMQSPAALRRQRLSDKAGGGVDPCAAFQINVELEEGRSAEMVFLLGAADSAAEAAKLLGRFRDIRTARRELEQIWEFWNQTLGVVYAETPDPALNVLANGWLLYQTLSARFWGRSGFYQSGGAMGFRDQLQDSVALIYGAAAETRQQLLRSASRQFVEGDVQHWWHETTGRGVRTRISDDLLWLPYTVSAYVEQTGDTGVLDEVRGFLTGPQLAEGEEGRFDLFPKSDESDTLYEHCRRAIERSWQLGAHKLPLMGAGDWNDGMNRVGIDGRGESVWLAMFLVDVLARMERLAIIKGDQKYATVCRTRREELNENIETHAWDGEWYLRAWFDDGTPLGTKGSTECQIDTLPQAWSVIAEVGPPARRQEAMAALNQHLVDRKLQLIRLFEPPFDDGPLQPGYIKGYLPGVRENGGQYTHAAIWATMAAALAGENERAWEYFRIINPVMHATDAESTARYKVEPYVMAADVYTTPGHEGRGGWTWYTGSAGWMYRLCVETFLGITVRHGTQLSFRPCVPDDWTSFKVVYRYYQTFYHITLHVDGRPSHHVTKVTLDGRELPDKVIHLINDHVQHNVEVRLGVS